MATEKRLIDANALRKEIDCCYIETFNDKYTIVEQIAQAPTVDAVEVVHGRWEHMGEADYKCSVCGFRFTSGDPIEAFPYCRCGAKMDGDGDG